MKCLVQFKIYESNAPAKQSQHFNATYRNAMCYDMLGVVGSSLKIIKFFIQHLWMLHDVVFILARFVQ